MFDDLNDDVNEATDAAAAVQTITTDVVFDRLEPARQWIDDNTEQGGEQLPLLVMTTTHMLRNAANSKKQTYRKYHVTEVRAFLDEMQRTQAQLAAAPAGAVLPPPTFNELVLADTPCKTFAEFDFKKFDLFEQFGASDSAELLTMLDAMFARFTEFLLARLNEAMRKQGLERQLLARDAIVLTAHKPGKWSVHLIIDPPLSDESVVWRTQRDCGNFIADVLEAFNEPLATEALDTSVYSDNHALRIYRAAKPEEPARILRDKLPRYSEATMLRSLISCIRVRRERLPSEVTQLHAQDDESALVQLSSAFIARYAPTGDDWLSLTCNGGASANKRATRMTISLRVRRGNGPTSFSTTTERTLAICESAELASYSPRRSLNNVDSHRAMIACDTNYCELRGGEHKNTHFPVYLELDLHQMRWRQSCMSGTCDKSRAKWHDMGGYLRDACLEFRCAESRFCKVLTGVNRCLFRGGSKE